MTRGARTAWIDCAAGVSGDMLLGALVSLGAVEPSAFGLDATITVDSGRRAGIEGVSLTVTPGADQPHRKLGDVLAVVDTADVPQPVRDRAAAVFRRIADAEARVHGQSPDDVEFHEVGAVDAVVDILNVCNGFHGLGVAHVTTSPIALGGGRATTAHGPIPIPGPAVVQLLAGTSLIAYGGPVDVELATPTGVALLAELADTSGPMPPMTVERVGVGLGQRELDELPNALRIIVGEAAAHENTDDTALLVEANVDDLDPRLWPVVIERLLTIGGAVDAWITPIVMKKGRPAHTISALTDAAHLDATTTVLFGESSTIGVRISTVGKRALDRTWIDVDVDGQRVRVKVATSDGVVVNASPEFDDVAAAANALGRPVKAVLAAAIAAAQATTR